MRSAFSYSWPRLILLPLAALLGGAGCASPGMRPGVVEPAKTGYTATYTPAPVTIDGTLQDPAWQRAAVITDFRVPVTLEPAVSRTEARVLWDDEYLYVGFRAYDLDIWGTLTEHDSNTCHEDVLEVFFQPEPDGEDLCYYTFEVNVLGTMLDAWVPKGKRGLIRRGIGWDAEGVRIATHVEGTLNDWNEEDRYWQMEIAIPFAGLPSLEGRRPRPGDTWRFHLARYDYSVYLPGNGLELSSCAPLSELNFHRYEDWVPLRFEE